MPLTIALVFIAVFALVVLLATGLSAGATREQKQILARLDSLQLAAERGGEDESLSLVREEMLSSLPTLNRWMARLDLFPWLRRLLAQAGVAWTPAGLAGAMLAAGAAAALGAHWRTGTWPFAALLGAAGAAGPLLYVYYRRWERFGEIEMRLPQALDLMVNALRAGHSLISALEMVSKEMPEPLAGEFKIAFDEQNFGLDLREALGNLGERVPIHDVHIVVTAILIQKETGGNLAEILDKVAYVIRERFRLRRQVRVHTAQGRLTGWILAGLPVILGTAVYLIRPDYMARLWQDPTGVKLIYAATVMTLIGGLIIRKIVQVRV
jgi:tight adherence protein B